MKRLLPMLTTGQAVNQTPLGTVVNPVSAAMSLAAPNPRNLTAQEDPGTGLYGYLNEYGVWVIAPTFRYATSFNTDAGLATVQISNGRWGAIDRRNNIISSLISNHVMMRHQLWMPSYVICDASSGFSSCCPYWHPSRSSSSYGYLRTASEACSPQEVKYLSRLQFSCVGFH